MSNVNRLITLSCVVFGAWGMLYMLVRFEGPLMAISVAVGVIGLLVWKHTEG